MTDSRIKKINTNIKKIQDVIEKQGKYGYYIIYNDSVILANKDHNKEDAKENFLEKIEGNKKYIDSFVYVVDIVIDDKYVTHEHKLVAGPLSLKIKQYHINDKYKLKYKSGYKNGAIWYTNDDILLNAFKFSDIKKMIKIIHDNDVNIISMGKVRAVDILDGNLD